MRSRPDISRHERSDQIQREALQRSVEPEAAVYSEVCEVDLEKLELFRLRKEAHSEGRTPGLRGLMGDAALSFV
jgi:hypothetical protein